MFVWVTDIPSAKADEFCQSKHSPVCFASSLNMHHGLDYLADVVVIFQWIFLELVKTNLLWIWCLWQLHFLCISRSVGLLCSSIAHTFGLSVLWTSQLCNIVRE